MLLAKRSVAKKLGLPIKGRILSYAVAGVPPEIMGIGPAFAKFDDVLKEEFIPALFGEPKEALPNNDPRIRLAPLPVKMGALAFP